MTSAAVEAFILQWRREAVFTNSRASTAIWESAIQSKSHPWGDRDRDVLGWVFCTWSWRETQPDLVKDKCCARL